jgi:hypothetical protein
VKLAGNPKSKPAFAYVAKTHVLATNLPWYFAVPFHSAKHLFIRKEIPDQNWQLFLVLMSANRNISLERFFPKFQAPTLRVLDPRAIWSCSARIIWWPETSRLNCPQLTVIKIY